MRVVHGGFSRPIGGVSPMKQEKVEEEDKKEKVAYTGPALPEGGVPPTSKSQGVIKESKPPPWYKNLFQKELTTEQKGRKEEGYSLPSTPTWSKFENSKVGKTIDAKGIVKEKNNLMRLLGYGKGEEKDLAMDVGAFVTPAADIAHATTKAAEGKYLDAGLYALFAAVPGAAGPLVNKAKKLLGMGDKVGAEKLLKETIEKNKKAINTNLKPKGGVDGGKIKFDKDHKNLIFHNMKEGGRAAEKVTKISRTRGAKLDDFIAKADGPDFSKMDYSGSVTKLPSKGTRDFVKVDLPNGDKQIFYKSSGTGGKAGSKGEWIPFEGHRGDGWYIKTGSRGKFAGKNIETIFTHHNAAGDVISKADWIKQGSKQDLEFSHGVYEQVKKLGLDPWKELEKGNLVLDHIGQGFKYGSKEYVKIADQLKNMKL